MSSSDHYYIDAFGVVTKVPVGIFSKEDIQKLKAIGNYFESYEDAEFKVERLKVISELSEFTCNFKQGHPTFYLSCVPINDTNWLVPQLDFAMNTGTLHFPSKDSIASAVNKIGTDRIRKYLFNAEDRINVLLDGCGGISRR